MSINWNEKEFEEIFIEAVKTSTTIANVLRKIGNLSCMGGNYRQVHKHVKRLGLDISHWLGKAHLKGQKRPSVKGKSLTEILVKDSQYSTKHLKQRLITAGLIKYSCAICGLSEWQNKTLVLQLDHENGDNKDNTLTNLRLLCPNCHSQTPTYCGRNLGYITGKEEQRTTTC